MTRVQRFVTRLLQIPVTVIHPADERALRVARVEGAIDGARHPCRYIGHVYTSERPDGSYSTCRVCGQPYTQVGQRQQG